VPFEVTDNVWPTVAVPDITGATVLAGNEYVVVLLLAALAAL
jgi:hypothetical protein